jgi:hypothetical protein
MFPSSFGGSEDEGELFDEMAEFVPAHLPDPGSFLQGQDVFEGERHVRVHRLSEELFEERGVYDMTFGYNLAKLNLDTRHPDAGFRYAEEADDPDVLRAEFTPTTAFCPQSDTLTKGAFRAWNGLGERHDYDLVRVRVDEMHQQADAVNEALRQLENNGGVGDMAVDLGEREPVGQESGPDAPF